MAKRTVKLPKPKCVFQNNKSGGYDVTFNGVTEGEILSVVYALIGHVKNGSIVGEDVLNYVEKAAKEFMSLQTWKPSFVQVVEEKDKLLKEENS